MFFVGCNSSNQNNPEEHECEATWVIDKEATCEEDGSKHSECTTCGEVLETEVISKLGHDYSECISNDDNTHTKICSNDINHTITENCFGGTATCINKAVCKDCKKAYGDLGDCNYINGICINCKFIIGTDGLEYELINNTAYSVTGYTGTSGDVYVPATYKGLPVKSIGENAFKDCTILTNVVISEGLTSIGAKAFYQCIKLQSIEIPSSVSAMYTYAFYKCSSLVTVTFGENSQLQAISGMTFNGCSSLVSIEIPANVTKIYNNWAFEDCFSLKEIRYNAVNCENLDYDCITFSDAGKESGELTVIIGKDVQKIPDRLFYKANHVKKLVFEENSVCTSIGVSAFRETPLISVELPNSVTILGQHAFDDCQKLTTFTIKENSQLKYIGAYAFYGCKSLTSIEIPASVTKIWGGAFRECTSLTSVTFAKNSQLTEIAESAFNGCSALKQFIIPSGVTTLGTWVFGNCTALTYLVIPASVQSIGYYIIVDCGQIKVYCEAGSKPSSWDSSWDNYSNWNNNNKRPIYWQGQWEYVDGIPTAK